MKPDRNPGPVLPTLQLPQTAWGAGRSHVGYSKTKNYTRRAVTPTGKAD